MAEDEKSISGDDNSARPWQSYHTVFTNAKAGMEGVDKEKVQRIVYEMSKGSKFFDNEERKEAFLKHKTDNMHAYQAKLTATDIAHYQKIADKKVEELEATRDLSRIWLHVDMDAFYAAVETLVDPSLKGKPVAVGGLSMISTANYEARKFGVRAAMPGFIARKLCPQLVFVPVDFKKYNHYSGLTRKVFQKYDPNFVAASLDEAYLDVTHICNDRGMTGAEVAEELRSGVYEETGLTCSAGVAPNRLLAKVCSDINKPNGQFVLPNDRMAVMTFISSLPIRKIGGIGKVTENVLKEVFGINTCEDMLRKSSFICALFSRTSADFFLSVGLGLGGTNAPEGTVRKSMSNERTFVSTDDEASLIEKLVDLAENLSSDMKKEGLSGRTLTLKLKTSSFEVRTRAATLQTYICSSEDILKHALKLLKAELPVSLRLMGLRMSHFNEGGTLDPKQRTLHNFIVPENASGRRVGEHSLIDSVNNEDTLSNNQDINFSNDPQWTCEPFDIMDVNQIRALDPTEFRHGNEAESRENFDHQADDSNRNEDMASCSRNLFPCGGAAQLDGRDSSSAQLAQSCLNRQKQVNNCTEDEQSPYNSKEPIFWLDGYRCSVCGIELPSCFEEERQEHFDFHFAERLQEEETNNVQRIIPRILPKEQMSQGRKKKKVKTSPSQGSHIPIDIFFAKTNHTP